MVERYRGAILGIVKYFLCTFKSLFGEVPRHSRTAPALPARRYGCVRPASGRAEMELIRPTTVSLRGGCSFDWSSKRLAGSGANRLRGGGPMRFSDRWN